MPMIHRISSPIAGLRILVSFQPGKSSRDACGGTETGLLQRESRHGCRIGLRTCCRPQKENSSLSGLLHQAIFMMEAADHRCLLDTMSGWQLVPAVSLSLSERFGLQLRCDLQNALKTYNFNPPTTTVDFKNPRTFGKVKSDPRTASLGAQPLINLTLQLIW